MLKNLKVAFKIKQLYRILEPEKSRRLTVLIIFAFSIVWASGFKSLHGFLSTLQNLHERLHGRKKIALLLIATCLFFYVLEM